MVGFQGEKAEPHLEDPGMDWLMVGLHLKSCSMHIQLQIFPTETQQLDS